MFNASTEAPIFPTTRHYTRTFADDAARTAATPDFVGQFAFQLDNSTVYRSDGTSAGEWASIFSIESLTVTSGLNAAQLVGIRTPIATKTTTYTVTVNDHTLLGDATSASMEFDLPDATTCAGQIFMFKKIDSSGNTVGLDPNGSQVIEGGSAGSTYILSLQYEAVTIQSDGAKWWILELYQAP